MKKTGIAELRLCKGPIPHYREMVLLAKPLMEAIINEFGTKETVKRFSNPLWYQCLACCFGFEYQFSGMTTVVIKAIKDSIEKENIGLKICGGKGKLGLETPKELQELGDNYSFSDKKIEKLVTKTKLAVKVDNAAIQDSYSVYFHSVIVDENGNFAVINQGMNTERQMVRRYHWYNLKDLDDSNIAGSEENIVLDLTKKNLEDTRKLILDLAKESKKTAKIYLKLNKDIKQTNLLNFKERKIVELPYYLRFPKKLNVEALEIAKNASNFKEFLCSKGIGSSTLRGLAFVANLIYGSEISWKDPIKFCYAYGTKAGKPWYVQKKAMRKSAEILRSAVENAKIGRREKLKILMRLSKFI